METIIRKEMGLNRKAKLTIALGITAFVSLSVVICLHLFFGTREVVRKQTIRSITNISQLNEDSVSRAITNRRTLLLMLAHRLERRGVDDVDAVLEELSDFREYYEFANMGVLDRNRTLHMLSGLKRDLADTDFARDLWDAHFHLSESYPPFDGGEHRVNAFSVPVYRDGEIAYVLLATYQSRKLTARMNLSSMEGKGYSFLINQEGAVVLYPDHYEDETYNALMRFIDQTPQLIPDETGDGYFTYDGDRYYAHFEALSINDWFLMTCARESDVFADVNTLLRLIFVGMGLLLGIILVSLLSIVYSIYRSRKALRYTVYYDSLLGIANMNALEVYFRKLPPQELASMYMVVFDVDKFKEFNYIYGDAEGDRLLKYIARVFRKEVSGVDLFRYMTDHFVTLDRAESREALEEKMNAMLARFRRDIDKGIVYPFDTSAGVRKINPGEGMRLVLSDALIAKKTIKGNHLRHYAFYDEDIRRQRVAYMEMESEFTAALHNGEFRVYYQPKVDMATGEIVGAEALARWIKPDGRMISPGMFVPCFEKSRQICILDGEMLTQVCRQMVAMQRDGLAVKPVSVNLSRVHMRHSEVFDRIGDIVRESGVDPSKLSFEITESALYEDTAKIKRMVAVLHELGCKVDMDDYGVGVSGPKALASNPFDVVKLDKSFIDRIEDEHVADLVQSTIRLAKKWGMDILAEGVEEAYQVEKLVSWGCTVAQGYYYSRPVPEEEYRAMLAKH